MDARQDFTEVYEQHFPLVVRTANDVLHNVSLAEDVAQDVFLSLWHRNKYNPTRGPLGPYLRMLARSRALDLWRRNRTSDNVIEALKGHAAISSNAAEMPADVLVGGVERMCTRSAVKRLPIDQRTAIALLYWGDLTCGQAAEREEIPLGTAKSRVRLGLVKLAQDPALLL